MARLGHIRPARAHGLWTYETRQGRKAATVVCSASAVVTLAYLSRLSCHSGPDIEQRSIQTGCI